MAPAQEDGKKERQRRERVDEDGSVLSVAPGLVRLRRELAEPIRLALKLFVDHASGKPELQGGRGRGI